jgi:excisionase family DNA binding protein
VAGRTDRVHRVALYRRGRASAPIRALLRTSSATPEWLPARQEASVPNNPNLVAPERPEFYTREAAARRLGVGKTTVWELTTRGLIGVAYIGSKPLIPAVELERYIASLIDQARERATGSSRLRKTRS